MHAPCVQLAERGHFLEVAYLVLFGNLPTTPQLATFQVGVPSVPAPPELIDSAAICRKLLSACKRLVWAYTPFLNPVSMHFF